MANLQGYNVLNVPNEEQLFEHLNRAPIPAIQYLDNAPVAIKTKAQHAKMDVTWRQNRRYKSSKVTTLAEHDGALHLVYPDPVSFLDERVRVLDSLGWNGDIRIHAHNEPEWSPAVLDWSTKLVRLAGKQKIPVGIGAWAVGNPRIADIPMARDLLAALNENREYAVLFLHEYSMAHWTSGFTEDGITQPGDRLYFTKFIPRNMWPKDRTGFTFYHCGRFWHWVRYCLSIGIQPPRIIINEASFDDVEEGLKEWANKLPRPSNYHNIRGYKSLEYAWRLWYPDWSMEDAYFEQQAALDEFVYSKSPVEARLMFGLGDSGGWDPFNLWNAKQYQKRLEQVTDQPKPAPVPPPLQPAPPNHDRRYEKYKVDTDGVIVSVYTFARLDTGVVTKIDTGIEIGAIPALKTADGWIPVSVRGFTGWVRADWLTLTKANPPAPEPPAPEPKPTDADFAQLLRDLIAATNRLAAAVEAQVAIEERFIPKEASKPVKDATQEVALAN